MEELQLIYLILSKRSLEPLFINELSEEYFVQYREIIDFILKFNMENMDVPSLETVASTFPEVEWPEEEENSAYLAKQIKENYVYNKISEVFSMNKEVIKANSFEGLSKLTTGLNELLAVGESSYDSILKRDKEEDNEGVGYITTGFKLLDEQIRGFRNKNELVTVVGRTRIGKSWILLKMLLENWKAGLNVGLYSGEMGRKDIIDRFDCLNVNRSNTEIAEGLYAKDPSFIKYKQDLADRDNEFVLQTFETLRRKATVRDIEAMIVKYKLDVIGIDQLSLMSDIRYKKGDSRRETYDNISMDLFNLAEKYNVVIILLVQLNREGAKTEFPKLEQISESDNVAQNSSKVVGLSRDKDNVLSIGLLKNRYGNVGKNIRYTWDIDMGLFKEVTSDEVTVLEGSDDLFI